MGRQRPLRTLPSQGPLSGAKRSFNYPEKPNIEGQLSATSGHAPTEIGYALVIFVAGEIPAAASCSDVSLAFVAME